MYYSLKDETPASTSILHVTTTKDTSGTFAPANEI